MGVASLEFQKLFSKIDIVSRHRQSLTVPVEGGYFSGADVGSPIWDHREVPSFWLCTGSPLPPAGPDYALKGMPVYLYIYIYSNVSCLETKSHRRTITERTLKMHALGHTADMSAA